MYTDALLTGEAFEFSLLCIKNEIVIGIIGKTHGVKRARKPMLIARTRNELILLSAIDKIDSLSKSKFSNKKLDLIVPDLTSNVAVLIIWFGG